MALTEYVVEKKIKKKDYFYSGFLSLLGFDGFDLPYLTLPLHLRRLCGAIYSIKSVIVEHLSIDRKHDREMDFYYLFNNTFCGNLAILNTLCKPQNTRQKSIELYFMWADAMMVNFCAHSQKFLKNSLKVLINSNF